MPKGGVHVREKTPNDDVYPGTLKVGRFILISTMKHVIRG